MNQMTIYNFIETEDSIYQKLKKLKQIEDTYFLCHFHKHFDNLPL